MIIKYIRNIYTNDVKTSGDIEAKYLAMGTCKVKSVAKAGSEITKKYYIYYLEELKTIDKKYPVVVVLNGAGAFTAISIMEHKDKYKTAVALSPTHEETAHQFGWKYDLTKINIPTLMIAGTNGEFETQAVIPIEKMIEMYNKIPSSKVMLRRIGAEHGQMLYSADGYVTAWFMWQLKGDEEAEKAFIGDSPEIENNKLYQDIQISIE